MFDDIIVCFHKININYVYPIHIPVATTFSSISKLYLMYHIYIYLSHQIFLTPYLLQ